LQVKISDKITLMLTEQGFTYSNLLHINDDVQAVIETGMDGDGLQGLDPLGIDLIINSHHHLDHRRGNGLFPRAQVMIHGLETEALRDENAYVLQNSLDMWDELMPDTDRWSAFREIGFSEFGPGNKPFDPDRSIATIAEGQIIDFGTVKAQVLHTPGHSAGHCCFFFPEEEFLFSSDICLTKAGPWYGEHLADPAQMMRSIDRLIELDPPRLVSSHTRELVENPVPALREFRQRIEKRGERVYKYLVQNPSDLHVLSEQNLIYRAHPTLLVVFWEKLMLLKHIEQLKEEGLVRQLDSVYYGV